MRKIITILILSALFFSQIGYRLLYIVQRHLIKEQAEEQLLSVLNDNQFEQISQDDNLNDIIWEEPGKEFSLKGQLYDVAKKEIVNGRTILFCLNDKNEEQLIEDMLKKIRSDADSGPAHQDGKHTLKLQVSDFILFSAKPVIHNFFTKPLYYQYTAVIQAAIKEVNTPPPNTNLYFKKLTL